MRLIAFFIALTLLIFSFGGGLGVIYQELGDSQDLSAQQEQPANNQSEPINDPCEKEDNSEEEFFVASLQPPHVIVQRPEFTAICDPLLLNQNTKLEIHTPPPRA